MSCALFISIKLSLFTDTYFTSSNLTIADNQLFMTFMIQIWNAISILDVFYQ